MNEPNPTAEGSEQCPPPGRLSWEQVHGLMEILHEAFVFLRSPGYGYFYHAEDGSDELEALKRIRGRSVGFGEALHNLPGLMFKEHFRLDRLLRDIEHFAQDEPDLERFARGVQRIIDMGSDALPS